MSLDVEGEVAANPREAGVVTVKIDGADTTLARDVAEKLLIGSGTSGGQAETLGDLLVLRSVPLACKQCSPDETQHCLRASSGTQPQNFALTKHLLAFYRNHRKLEAYATNKSNSLLTAVARVQSCNKHYSRDNNSAFLLANSSSVM